MIKARITTENPLRPTWLYTVQAEDEQHAELIIVRDINRMGSHYAGHDIEGMGFQLLSRDAKSVLQWFMDIILATKSPRTFIYEVTLHLGKATQKS